jgi:excisionase family DNA binding protein
VRGAVIDSRKLVVDTFQYPRQIVGMTNLPGTGDRPEERLLRKKQVAKTLACSPRTVDRLVNAGRLTRVKILGGIRFRFSQVQMLMNGGQL